jgi:deoxyribonuclease-4
MGIFMIKLNKLHFLTGGFPTITKGNFLDALNDIKNLKLDGMELEFVQSTWLKYKDEELIKKIKKEKDDLIFTAHASYYINLASLEKQKIHMAKQRIIEAAEACASVNGYSITFHPAYYLDREKTFVYNETKNALKETIKQIKDKGLEIWIRPETTGKATQLGDLEECIKLSEDMEMVLPCIDFAHLHARYNGKNNTKEEWIKIMNLLENRLGRLALDNMHVHMSGINYSEKGERNHLILENSDLNWKVLLDLLKEYKIKGTIISESPNIEQDALFMKKYYNKLF